MGLQASSVPIVLALLVASGWYAMRVAGPDIAVRRRCGFGAGILAAGVALVGPLDRYGEDRLLSAHMMQVVLLLSVVPALIVYGLPDRLILRRLGWAARLTSSVGPALLLLLAALAFVWTLHVPAVFDAVTPNPALDDASHVLLLVAGFAMTLPLAGPIAIQGFGSVAYLVVAEVGVGVLGIWLAWYPELVYTVYDSAPTTLGLARDTDQALAGALLLVAEEPILGAECAALFIAALRRSDEEDARADQLD